MKKHLLKKHSGKYTIFQLSRALPKSMTYKRYKVIIDYLIESGKITVNKEGKIVWALNDKFFSKRIKTELAR